MKRLWLILFFLSFALAETKIIAISYFDNTSGLEKYNPLSKGLADMLITDLSKGKSIQIVEREKLESLLKEIDLGEGKFIDSNTAQKLGGGLGAEYILTGAFLSFDPMMRIDARIIEVGTGKVVVSEEVTGKADDFLQLESQLANSLIDYFNIETDFQKEASKSINLNAILNYSEAIDLTDKGFNYEASELLERTVQDYPEFSFAKEKFDALRVWIESIRKKRFAEENEKLATAQKKKMAELNKEIEQLKAKLDPSLDNFAKIYFDLVRSYWQSKNSSAVRELNSLVRGMGSDVLAFQYKGYSLDLLVRFNEISTLVIKQRTNAEEYIIKLTEWIDKHPSCDGEVEHINEFCISAVDALDNFLNKVEKWPEEKELADAALVKLKSSNKYKNLSLIKKLEEEIRILSEYDQYTSLVSKLEKILELRSNINFGRERDLDLDRLSLGGDNENYEQHKDKGNYYSIVYAYKVLDRPHKAQLWYDKFKSRYPREAKKYAILEMTIYY